MEVALKSEFQWLSLILFYAYLKFMNKEAMSQDVASFGENGLTNHSNLFTSLIKIVLIDYFPISTTYSYKINRTQTVECVYNSNKLAKILSVFCLNNRLAI